MRIGVGVRGGGRRSGAGLGSWERVRGRRAGIRGGKRGSGAGNGGRTGSRSLSPSPGLVPRTHPAASCALGGRARRGLLLCFPRFTLLCFALLGPYLEDRLGTLSWPDETFSVQGPHQRELRFTIGASPYARVTPSQSFLLNPLGNSAPVPRGEFFWQHLVVAMVLAPGMTKENTNRMLWRTARSLPGATCAQTYIGLQPLLHTSAVGLAR